MPATPINMDQFLTRVSNLYEAVIVTAKRARMIHADLKLALNQHTELLQQTQITPMDGEDESEPAPNPDQSRISLIFENLRKPTEIAVDELEQGRIIWRYQEPAAEAKPQDEAEEVKE